LELYDVPKTDQSIEKRLRKLGIKTVPEYTVSHKGKRVRVDLAIISDTGKIAIECDNDKAHASITQRLRDKLKDAFLRRWGWRVLRFKEKNILEKLDQSVARVKKAVRALEG
jgi:very-short-patch-repair endonuclease